MSSFGEELKRQRELREISLREIADATKINIRFLESLENNDFKHLPGGQFNKGFIRAYARHIGVDGESMVDAYLMEMRKLDETEKAVSRPAAPRPSKVHQVSRQELTAAVVLLSAAAAVAVLAGWWMLVRRPQTAKTSAPPARSSRPAPPAAGPTPSRAAASPESTAAVSPQSTAAGSPQSTAAGSSQSAAAAPSAPGGSTSGGTQAVETPGTGSGPLPEAASPAPPPAPALAPLPGADPSAGLSLIVMPAGRAHLDLLCDGKRLFSGPLEPGRSTRFQCAGVFEIATDDAGASNFTVNGERIYLGRRGQAISGRHVSAANYADYLKAPAEDPPR